ncbi:MAG TPA: hypothetical protein VNO25_08765 [Streptosporangiaceae bacterium]|jgi:hypothetical protein|nr:hypothetical protein [Streptosporangiaceae bacterium]HWN60746.1 hypothetical protein [Streptosporangiaceae bacterium]
MRRSTLILFLWLIIGAIAAGQRGYYGASLTCTDGATIAATIAAGPLNYIGLNPKISCSAPKPSG